jgi:hypothetical protein
LRCKFFIFWGYLFIHFTSLSLTPDDLSLHK